MREQKWSLWTSAVYVVVSEGKLDTARLSGASGLHSPRWRGPATAEITPGAASST